MSVVAASGFGGLVWVLFLLACPLMMIFMMRGMHGGHRGHGRHGGHGHGGDDATPEPRTSRASMSLEELKRERDELNALIGERAEQEAEAART